MASTTSLQTIDWVASARTLFDQSDNAMFIFQPQDLKLVEVNARAEQLTGLSRPRLSNGRVDELLESGDDEALMDVIDACRAARSFEAAESICLKRNGGSALEIRLTVSQLPAEPEPLGLLIVRENDSFRRIESETAGTREGISERERANSELREMLEKLRIRDRAIALAETGIVIADARLGDLPIVYCNAAFERMTGYSQQELLGRNCRFLQAHDLSQPGRDTLLRAIKDQRECRTVLRNYRKDGTMFWNELSVSPVHDERG